MIAEPQSNWMSPQDYLDWEATQDGKYFYVDRYYVDRYEDVTFDAG